MPRPPIVPPIAPKVMASASQPGDDVQEIEAEIAAVDVAGRAGEDERQGAEAHVGDARAGEVHRHDRRQQLGGEGVGEDEERGHCAVAPGRARQGATDAAPARAREPVAQAGILADIGERKADQRHRQPEDVEQAEIRERPFVEEVDPHQPHQAAPHRQHDHRQQEADQKLAAAAAILEAIAQDGEMIPQIAADARAPPEARPAQGQHHQHEVAEVDGVELAQLAVVERPAGRQVPCGRRRLGDRLGDGLAPRRGRIAHGWPFWLDCTAKSFMLRCNIY